MKDKSAINGNFVGLIIIVGLIWAYLFYTPRPSYFSEFGPYITITSDTFRTPAFMSLRGTPSYYAKMKFKMTPTEANKQVLSVMNKHIPEFADKDWERLNPVPVDLLNEYVLYPSMERDLDPKLAKMIRKVHRMTVLFERYTKKHTPTGSYVYAWSTRPPALNYMGAVRITENPYNPKTSIVEIWDHQTFNH